MDARVKTWAVSGGKALAAQVPRLVLGAFGGSLTGALGFGAVGAAAAFGAHWWWSRQSEVPAWLLLSLWLCPVVLGAAGFYVGAVRGLLRALARALVEGQLVGHLYALVKPAVASALRTVRGGQAVSASDVAAAVSRAMELVPAEVGEPTGLGDRVAGFLAARSRRLLVVVLAQHVARARDGAEAVRSLETFGLQRLQLVLLSSLADLFSAKLTVVMALAFLACVAPQVVYVLTR
ncbi:MAG: hypothetical protein K1X89_18205 [Myxococcaceae bacterium]|nr:hypothetical protein [Myxococcaceae bacterium]